MRIDFNNKKNIMYIFNDAGFGGAGQSLLDTLVEIKDKVKPIVVIRDDADVEDRFARLGVQCYGIHFATDYVKSGSADANKREQNFKQSYEAAMQLIPIIEKENIDLIHINSSVSHFAAIAALKAHIPYVWHIRELMKEHYNYEFLNEELRVSLYKKADKLITISDYVQEQYFGKYGLETYRLYDGLNISRFKGKIVSREFTNKTFIVAAMITPEKGQWDAVCATEFLVRKGYNDIKVKIVGSGTAGYVWALTKYIKKKKLENNIRIFSFQEDLSSLRAEASYAITCSQNEALGRVTIEAMLAGNVVIGARSGGTTEIIGENEERGFLYELGNSKSLADAMERAMACDSEKKYVLLRVAQEYAEKIFDSKKYCTELLKIYDEAIGLFEPCDNKEFLNKLEAYYYSVKDTSNIDVKNNVIPYKKSALMFPVVLKWLEIRQNGHFLSEYFRKNNIYTIAVYGMGALGCRLYDELEGSDIQVRHLIDRNPNGMDKIFEFSLLNKEKLDVDAVVVTVIFSEEKIINEIKGYGYTKVIGLREVIDSFDII